ncbi:hypothetical protein JB92DRAFT_2828265 [Gautieria morchelliformis]|nr:hypothetical protein JB92DRAFT_2828265 [Gautieria morchelliformis]
MNTLSGADASCSLGCVITQLEAAGFEVKNIDVLGVHYSVTIYRWYKDWLSNKAKVIAKYEECWYRIWVYFFRILSSARPGMPKQDDLDTWQLREKKSGTWLSSVPAKRIAGGSANQWSVHPYVIWLYATSRRLTPGEFRTRAQWPCVKKHA